MSNTIFSGSDESSSSTGKDPLDFPLASSRFCTVWLAEDDNDDVYLSVKVEPAHLGSFSYNVSPTRRAEDFLEKIRDAWKQKIQGGGDDE